MAPTSLLPWASPAPGSTFLVCRLWSSLCCSLMFYTSQGFIALVEPDCLAWPCHVSACNWAHGLAILALHWLECVFKLGVVALHHLKRSISKPGLFLLCEQQFPEWSPLSKNSQNTKEGNNRVPEVPLLTSVLWAAEFEPTTAAERHLSEDIHKPWIKPI